MHTKLRVLASVGGAAVGLLLMASPALAGSITSPSSNPYTVPGDSAGTPQSFTVTATGFTQGQQIYIEQCDGTDAASTPGWNPTEHCDLGTSPSAKTADSSGSVTFTANDLNFGFTPIKGLSPQGLFTCGSPTDTNPNDGIPFFTNCQVRVSSSNTAATSDQAFITMVLPDAETPPPSTPEAPYAVMLPLGGAIAAGAYFGIRKFRSTGQAAA